MAHEARLHALMGCIMLVQLQQRVSELTRTVAELRQGLERVTEEVGNLHAQHSLCVCRSLMSHLTPQRPAGAKAWLSNSMTPRGMQLIVSLHMQRDELQAERTILVRNMSCIFKTAQLELQRKDEQLRELRRPRPGVPP
jgi:hypothetical protein